MTIDLIVTHKGGFLNVDADRIAAIARNMPVSSIVIEHRVPKKWVQVSSQFVSIALHERDVDLEFRHKTSISCKALTVAAQLA